MPVQITRKTPPKAEAVVVEAAAKPTKVARQYGPKEVKTPEIGERMLQLAKMLGYTDKESLRVINEFAYQAKKYSEWKRAGERTPKIDPEDLPCYVAKSYQLKDWLKLRFEEPDTKAFFRIREAINQEFSLGLEVMDPTYAPDDGVVTL
jgi:hypothetical protein